MGFQADRFLSASLAARTAAVPVQDLSTWFEGEPVWTVRGIDANALAKVEQAERRNQAAEALAEALASGDAAEITAGVREVLGRSGSIEGIYARQIEILVAGSVDPVIDHAHAAKLGEKYPIVFKVLVNKIMELTGLGAEVAAKKPVASTETPA